MRALPLALTLCLALAAPVAGEIYRWTDDAGSVHFTDSLQNVPSRYRSQIQTRSDKLPDAPARPAPAPASTPRVALERLDGGYVVAASINGRETARLLLDTGASTTLLSPRLADRLGLTVRRVPPAVLRTANGQVEAGWAEVDTIEVGGRRVGPLRVVIHDAIEGADGLLGLNFLGAFRVEIHAQGPSLTLSPP
ncbi:MAG: TIGR02281 family clan AA aspartic protease [Deltaproteobacteria bacterium]|nr:TIGR02281 family clan AA aspartic protease [Deltaproteobacteria bacterium]